MRGREEVKERGERREKGKGREGEGEAGSDLSIRSWRIGLSRLRISG
jgi:hypothetical protein